MTVARIQSRYKFAMSLCLVRTAIILQFALQWVSNMHRQLIYIIIYIMYLYIIIFILLCNFDNVNPDRAQTVLGRRSASFKVKKALDRFASPFKRFYEK